MTLRYNHQRWILHVLSAQQLDLCYHSNDESLLVFYHHQKLRTTVNRLHHVATRAVYRLYPLISQNVETFPPPVDLLFLGSDKTLPL